MQEIFVILFSFFISCVTYLILKKKAVSLPGGALVGGIAIAQSQEINLFLGACLGIFGHLLFVLVYKITRS